jgi:molybdopterin molybdotransferase
MTTVEDALRLIRENAVRPQTIKVPLAEALGKILCEPLTADRDFPPFNRVTMDGIAIAFEDFAAGRREFPIAGIGAAGVPQQTLAQSGACLEIMTGAMLPAGTDTVVRYEDVKIDGELAILQVDSIKKGQNIHRQGEDRRRGEVIVPAGRRISAAEIGVAATVGKSELEVFRPFAALILSSGDELVEVSETPLPHQIRRSNNYSIQALLQGWGLQVEMAHVVDDQAATEKLLAELLPRYDVLLLSGGVSKGKFDYIPAALEALGVQKFFHRVAQRPGKPFWFGRIPGGTVVFALPGNPVSSFVCTAVYFQDWLMSSWGISPPASTAQLTKDVHFRPDLNYYLQVRLHQGPNGLLLAEPVEGHGSGDLANLTDADAFLMLPRGRELFTTGEAFSIWPFRP